MSVSIFEPAPQPNIPIQPNQTRESASASNALHTSLPSLTSYRLPFTSLNEGSSHTYDVYYGRWHANLIFNTIESPIYLASVAEYTSKKPDVTLHDIRGHSKEDTNTPILATAHFRWSRHIKLGLGDPLNHPNDVVWEEMKNNSKFYTHSTYGFDFTCIENPTLSATLSNDSGAAAPVSAKPDTRRAYSWRRTNLSSDGVRSWARVSFGSYKLIKEASGETIAVFLSNGAKSWRKAGKLRVRDNIDERLEIVIVLGAASLAEKLRRRTKWAWMAGGSTAGP